MLPVGPMQSIPNALKVQQAAIAKLQRTVRHELQKLQAEEKILKLMVQREKLKLRRAATKRQPPADAGAEPEG